MKSKGGEKLNGVGLSKGRETHINRNNLLENEMGKGHGFLGLPIALQRRLIVGVILGVVAFFSIFAVFPTANDFVAFVVSVAIAYALSSVVK